MSQSVSEVGRRVWKGTSTENTNAVTPISIDTATAIVLPASPRGNGTYHLTGALECEVVIEGNNGSRYTTNGVTPTATVGQLLKPGSGVVSILLRGQDVIESFLVIGVAGGNTMTYQFFVSDNAS